jgi:enolase
MMSVTLARATQAVDNVNNIIADELCGVNVFDQAGSTVYC